jgi:hypothetical protein
MQKMNTPTRLSCSALERATYSAFAMRRWLSIICLFAALLVSSGAWGQFVEDTKPALASTRKAIPVESANALLNKANERILFMENRGQVLDQHGNTQSDVLFLAKNSGLKVALRANGISYQFEKIHYKEADKRQNEVLPRGPEADIREIEKVESQRLDMYLEGANPAPEVLRETEGDYTENYYNIASIPQGITGVKSYTRIRLKEVYPGIDWVIYTQGGKMKYDFIVQPGADPAQIRMRYAGSADMYIDERGALQVKTPLGELSEQAPVSFQDGQEIASRFVLDGAVLSLAFRGYDPTRILVVDPALSWGTYYGGAGSDVGFSTAVDGSGNVYLAGYTDSSTGIASDGHQNTFGGGNYDAFLVKFNAAGERQWATYYGGTGTEYGSSTATDGSGNAYLSGSTESSTGIASGGHQNTFGGHADAFLVKFDATGARQWATYYGGSGSDGANTTVDGSGNVYLGGSTHSGTGIASGGHQNSLGGLTGCDAFLAKFNADGVRQWATYYGGGDDDRGASTDTDGSGNVVLAGYTRSTTGIASGGHRNTYGGGFYEAFLVKFDAAGVRQWGTYYGTSHSEGSATATDGSGNVYLTGFTNGSTGVASGGHQNTYGGGNDAFLVKFNTSGVRQWATYYGGASQESGQSIAVDGSENVYLAGFTLSSADIASGGYQNTYGGSEDAFLVKFNASGVRQWGTYYGASGSDVCRGTAVDGSGNVYLAGYTSSSTGIASGGHQNAHGGGLDAFLAKFQGTACTTPSNLTYSSNPVSYCVGAAITANNATVTGIAPFTYSVSPALPAGLNLNTTTGAITGTPAAAVAATNYTVTATNTCGSTTVVVNITLGDNQAPSITCAANVTINTTAGLCTSTTTLTAPTVSDNCGNGVLGNALNFDGANDFVNCGNSTPFQTTTGTAEAWIKTSNAGGGLRRIINKESAWLLYLNNNVLHVYDFNTGGISAGITLNDNSWHHVALTFQPGTNGIKVYSDGILRQTTTLTSLGNLGNPVVFGGAPDLTTCFNGNIDEVRIWNVIRTQAEIQANMNLELSSGTGLVAAYHLNQGTAGGSNAGVNSATDASGNNLNGTLTNFTLSGASSNWVSGAPLGGLTLTNNAPATYALGSNTVTWTVADVAGNMNDCAQTVTVLDNQAPVITCPANITTNATSAAGAAVTFANATATDNCAATVARTAGPASGATFPIGVTSVQFTATDGGNNTASCAFTVTVNGVAPNVVCPANMTVDNDPNLCSAIVSFAATEVVGIPASTITYSQNPGTTFEKGTTTVTATATNPVNTGQCTFTVTVNDNQAPVISCAANVTINTTAGLCTGTTTLTAPMVSDNCPSPVSGNGLHFGQLGDKVSGSSTGFPGETTPRTIESWIKCGTQGVPAPIFSYGNTSFPGGPFSLQINAITGRLHFWAQYTDVFGTTNLADGNWHHVAVTYDGGTIRLYADGALQATQAVSISTVLNGTFSMGNIFGNWQLYGSIDDTRLWSVARTQAQIQASMNSELAGNESGLVAYWKFNQGIAGGNNAGIMTAIATTGPNGTLNNFALNGPTSNWVSGAGNSNAMVPTSNAPATYALGANTVTWTVADVAGNMNNCAQTVTVLDNQTPVITCPANITTNATSAAGVAVTFANASATDNCAATVARTAGPASGATFPIGVTSVQFTATDAASNTTSCAFTVTVNGVAPDVVCPANMTVYNDANQCSAIVSFAATDAVGNPASTITYSQNPDTAFAIGTTTVTATATNPVNSDLCTFTVTVLNYEAGAASSTPTLCINTPLTAITHTTTGAMGIGTPTGLPAGVNATWAANTITISGTPTASGIFNYSIPLAGACGNVNATGMITVNALPVVAPITGNVAVPTGYTIQLASTTPGGVWASSNLLVATVDNSGEVLGLATGTSTITYTVTVNGCSAFESVVVAIGTPIFDIGIFNEPANSDLYAIKIKPLVAVNGDYSAGTFTVRVPLAAGVSLSAPTALNTPLHGYNIFHEGTDATFRYYVFSFSNTPNPINWAANSENVVAILQQSGSCNGIGTFTLVTPYFDAPIIGDYYQELDGTGVQNAIYQAAASGPLDVTAPTITCPGNATAVADAGICSTVVTGLSSTPADNCSGFVVKYVTTGATTLTSPITGVNNISGAVFNTGVTTVNYTVTDNLNDGVGLTATCSFTVTVSDTENPAITICAPNQNVNLNTSCGLVVPNLVPQTTATDNCTVTITQSPAAGTILASAHNQTHSVTITATDGAGNLVTCTTTLTGKDITNPVITICAPNQNVSLNNTCELTVPNLAAQTTATDNCTVTVTQSPAAGTILASGHNQTHLVTIIAIDGAGNTLTCTTVLTSKDVTNPTITTCAPNQDVNLNGTCEFTVPNLVAQTTATDHCTTVTLTQSPAAGAILASVHNQTHSVTITATDGGGNVATCTTVLTGKDVTNPAITTCAPNQDVNLNSTCGLVVPNLAAQTTATDNCTVTVTQSPAAGVLLASGHNQTHLVTITATDGAGNAVTCTTTLTSKDVTNPTITTCAPNQDVNLNSTCELVVPNLVAQATATDNCTIVTLTQSPAAGVLLASGHNQTHSVTITATDGTGNVTTCTTVLTGKDVTNPAIATCAPNQDVNLNGTCGLVVPNLVAQTTATDNCTVTVTQSPAAGALLASGHNQTHPVTITATDGGGNAVTCTTVLTGKDITNPTITAAPNLNPTVNITGCSASVLSLGTPVTGDNCSVASVTWTATGATPASGNVTTTNIMFPLGSTTVVWTVADMAGNMTMSNQTVMVSTTLAATAVNVASPAICTGQSTNLSFNITGGQSPYTIVYSRTPGVNTTVTGYTNGQLIAVSPTTVNTPTVYTYALVSVTDAYGCVINPLSLTNTLTVNPLPTAANTTGLICSGNPFEFDLQAYMDNSGNGVPSDFSWYVLSDNPSVTGEVFTPTTNDVITTTLNNNTQFPQTVIYRVTPTSVAACLGASFDISITIFPVPDINATGATICSGTNTGRTVQNPSGVVGANFNWTATYDAVTGGAGSGTGVAFGVNAINETLVNTTLTPIDVVYVLTPIGTSPTFCPGTPLNITVTVVPTVGVPVLIGPTVLCQDDANSMYSATATNNTGILYSVSPVSAGVINPTTGEMNWDAAYSGTATISVVATGCNGSSQTRTLTVTVNPEPTITITQPNPVCISLNLNGVVIAPTLFGGTYTFHSTLSDANAGANALAGLAVTAASTDVYVRYTLPTGCFTTGFIDITIGACLQLTAKVLLQGPFNAGNSLMFDNLRTGNRIPSSDPYASGTFQITPSTTGNYSTHFVAVNGGGIKTINTGVLAVTGNNAIVDWVFIELRDGNDRNTVVVTRAALIQRDGDIVDMDGLHQCCLPV